MTLNEAYNYIDMLLDKADEPYFTTDEKHKFLNLAISEFINVNYARMGVDENARKALAPVTMFDSYDMSHADIASGGYTGSGHAYPNLGMKYRDDGVYDISGAVIANSTHTSGNESETRGWFLPGGAQMVIPNSLLYILSVSVIRYNVDDVIDSSTGQLYTGLTAADIVDEKTQSLRGVNVRDYYEEAYGEDPFSKTTEKEDSKWFYIENRLVISHGGSIRYLSYQSIHMPSVEHVFDVAGYGSPGTLQQKSFPNHYRKQIVQMAVRKMSGNVSGDEYQIKQIEASL